MQCGTRGGTRSGRKYEESYRVFYCPLYMKDQREEKRVKWTGDYYDAPVCKACYSRRICMEVHGSCNRRVRS